MMKPVKLGGYCIATVDGRLYTTGSLGMVVAHDTWKGKITRCRVVWEAGGETTVAPHRIRPAEPFEVAVKKKQLELRRRKNV